MNERRCNAEYKQKNTRFFQLTYPAPRNHIRPGKKNCQRRFEFWRWHDLIRRFGMHGVFGSGLFEALVRRGLLWR